MPTQTKERPILMSGPMAQAILEGRKTQTRRVIPSQPFEDKSKPGAWLRHKHGNRYHSNVRIREYLKNGEVIGTEEYLVPLQEWLAEQCPYGAPGDRLWVREATLKVEEHGYQGPVFVASELGGEILDFGLRPAPDDAADVDPDEIRTRPSIHMPRKYARILLEVISVRVERLHEISEEDATAEGASQFRFEDGSSPYEGYRATGTDQPARLAFALLWDNINAARGFDWDKNPWVWVVEFKLLEVKHGR